jgi:hypothetical protein
MIFGAIYGYDRKSKIYRRLSCKAPREQKGGAEPPLAAAWAGADARCPSARPRCKAGRQNASWWLPCCPSRAISTTRGSAIPALRQTQKVAPERSPRRTSRPGVPVGKGRGYFRAGARGPDRASRGLKGEEAVRQTDSCDWGGILAGSGRYHRHLSFHRHPSRLPCARAHVGPALIRLRP